jgi:hypothetical protein
MNDITGSELNKLMSSHQGHKVSFVLDESSRFDVIENQNVNLENVESIRCADCNVTIYSK